MAFSINVVSAEEFADVLNLVVELRNDGTPVKTYEFTLDATLTDSQIRSRVKSTIRRDFPAKTGDRNSLLGEVT